MLQIQTLLQRILLLCLPYITLPAAAFPGTGPDSSRTRTAFGSCNEQLQPQPLWESIIATRPVGVVTLTPGT